MSTSATAIGRAFTSWLGCVLAGALLGGCGKTHTGSPVLLGARWVSGGQETETLGVSGLVVSPSATQLALVFDRRLDGNKIEDGSGSEPRPRTDPPVHLAFAGKPASYRLTVVYASNANGGPSIWVSPAGEAAFPAAKTLTFSLDRASVTGQDGTPYTGPDSVTVTTAPFSVDVLVPAPGAAIAATPVPVLFNAPPSTATLPQHAHVLDARGAEIPTVTYVDNRNRQLWNVKASCAAGWPLNQTLTVVIDGAVTDLYGAPLGDEARATFSIAGDAAAGGSCGGDGGSLDGSVDALATDAPASDAGASDAGASDVAPDGGVDGEEQDAASPGDGAMGSPQSG